jgi:general secretion pathway protein G
LKEIEMQRITLRKSTQTRLQVRKSDVVRGGFTLTELLIVMAILVLLVSLIGPRLLGSKQKADINAVKTQIGMFQSALERYAVDMNKFPATEEGLAALVSKPGDDGSGSATSESGSDDASSADGDAAASGGGGNWDGPYIKTEKLPVDPWGKAYSYEYPPTHNKINVPDIWSFGPDGQENTDDDIKSWSGDGSSEGSEGSSSSSKE